MRRKDKEINDSKMIEEIIREAKVCRVAMIDGDMPYVIPMNFGFKDNCIYLHSAKEGRKIDILKQNSRVCFEMDIKKELIEADGPCKWGMKYLSVIGTGKAAFVEDLEEKSKALNAIMEKYSGRTDYNFAKPVLEGVAIIKIEIEEVTGKNSGYK